VYASQQDKSAITAMFLQQGEILVWQQKTLSGALLLQWQEQQESYSRESVCVSRLT
jgi:hypothetical protein